LPGRRRPRVKGSGDCYGFDEGSDLFGRLVSIGAKLCSRPTIDDRGSGNGSGASEWHRCGLGKEDVERLEHGLAERLQHVEIGDDLLGCAS
jgi:hypothetical protein